MIVLMFNEIKYAKRCRSLLGYRHILLLKSLLSAMFPLDKFFFVVNEMKKRKTVYMGIAVN